MVRVYKISTFDNYHNQKVNPKCEEISVQEAWIDDQTPEDISNFAEKLRIEGAYDVSYQAINMKKIELDFLFKHVPTEKDTLGEYGLIILILLSSRKNPI